MKRLFCAFLTVLLVLPTFSQALLQHPWQGKRVAYFGDSITDPKNSGSKKKYWGFLQDWLQIEPYVYGRSGRQWNDIPRQADLLKSGHGDDVDAIMIFIGTNDYNSAVPIGEWFTVKEEQVMAGIHEPKHLMDSKHRYPIMSDSTYRGRINKALDYVKRLFPTKQIVLLTPIHRAQFYRSEKNWQPSEDYTNKCGEYIDAYVESVKEAGNIWAVPVIDLNALCGLFPLMDEHAQFFANAESDRLHPNDAGHERMAQTLMQQLLMLPIFKDDSSRFWLGADISGTTAEEARGVQLMNAKGEPRENTALMKEQGLDAVRLRVWVNPKDGFCSQTDVLKMALRAKEQKMAIMIDFHYSDWWADPGHQTIPAAWKNLDYPQMKEALGKFTRETLQLLKDNGIDVKWVQVGNETTQGFLWDMGHAAKNMAQYAGLTQAGYDAVKVVYPQAKVIVHLDAACDINRYHFIFDGLKQNKAKWDMIGLSVYPYWDQESKLTGSDKETLEKCIANINALYAKYKTPLMIVETGYEASRPVEGKAFLKNLIHEASTQTGGHCKGVFYWAPEAERHYKLGAFKNHKPTAIMEAFTEAGLR